jgi:hypothetical protein
LIVERRPDRESDGLPDEEQRQPARSIRAEKRRLGMGA